MDDDIDIMNKHGVSVLGGGTIVIMFPPPGLTKNESLVFAAWLVAMADPLGDKFPAVLERVQNS